YRTISYSSDTSSVSCYVYCYRALRDLHSFPTRRSSDLAGRRHQRGDVEAAGLAPARHASDHPPARRPPRHGCRHRGHAIGRVGRSEEHTSELQSRENLVCRLLLEKKKKQKKERK